MIFVVYYSNGRRYLFRKAVNAGRASGNISGRLRFVFHFFVLGLLRRGERRGFGLALHFGVALGLGFVFRNVLRRVRLADLVELAERAVEIAHEAGFVLIVRFEIEFAGVVGAGVDERGVPFVVFGLLLLGGGFFVDGSGLEGSDTFEAPLIDGHLYDEPLFQKVPGWNLAMKWV